MLQYAALLFLACPLSSYSGEVRRVRADNEATPSSITQSSDAVPKDGQPTSADLAVDLDLNTQAIAQRNTVGELWIEIILKETYCVEYVIEFNRNSETNQFKWTCSEDNCSECEHHEDSAVCGRFQLTVDYKNAAPDDQSFPRKNGCKYGDVVKLTVDERPTVTVAEIAIFGKKGYYSIKYCIFLYERCYKINDT